MNILFGVTGSVAAGLVPKMVAELLKNKHDIVIVPTKNSLYFWDKESVNIQIYEEEHEWPGKKYEKGSDVLHINLRDWADVLLLAPLTANTLAKIANGLADNLLTSIIRAWDVKNEIIIAPAMNTKMWEHPATKEHLDRLNRWYKLNIIHPVSKKLACGETGVGAMAPISEIVKEINKLK
ncbi:hypothetical protein A2331_07015 [Candidatus Falkowbacteria bacterium RIFOXYB2_FULL_34_18]|uniref:Flavoprotein domain-containing protein n=1 Tax=Candidatus Falkowbacteria bacterium RIFOXYD2_FULL_34_120 TaxID=1798007 RepID=A0A1F5TSJ7_9BACT|nr:MAG: hypothetical protein A2331_07015 [Candidatus Falkowbacteria bacterium RIFOXYB2_FULL_34_18]OGF29929.1 MAG: hypothetical protein A2500_03660 [Candidatus Falkowbacteria bacterium RIFOXYC12_FULL_34_55]OGF37213.1 MAG: hypothetical protein A2466_02855 [Candidatus Falkowbacteria bacterium RIFOXYC2_FULL_34_220]OGF39467.1 MAG: hypothetical protein A2515_04035 [Candidatus Falkowbacteria bacterium RIFOXYD12_FULL_34_57]OGF41551.1 MAG: hypothetical protein A2531_02570 [Candidatus Falkowbacteria bact